MNNNKLFSIPRSSDFFNQFKKEKPETKNIFARIPLELHHQVNDICRIEDQSRYEIIRIALTLLVREYGDHREAFLALLKKGESK